MAVLNENGVMFGRPSKGVAKTYLSLQKELREALDQYAKDNNTKITHVVEKLIQEHIVDVATNQEGE